MRECKRKYKYNNSTKAFSYTLAYSWMLAVRRKIIKGLSHGNSESSYIKELAGNKERFYKNTQIERRACWVKSQRAKQTRDNLNFNTQYVSPRVTIQSYMKGEEYKKQKRDALNAVREDLAKWEGDLAKWNLHFYEMLRSKKGNSVKVLRSLMTGRGTRITGMMGDIRHDKQGKTKSTGGSMLIAATKTKGNT